VKKIKMARGITLTFEEGCNKYLENCRQQNLREGSINHYKHIGFDIGICRFFAATVYDNIQTPRSSPSMIVAIACSLLLTVM
jgi:hypothetical protein